MFALLSALVAPVIGMVGKSQEAKQKAAERKDRIEEAKAIATTKRIERGEIRATNLDEASIKNRGWKDEFILLVVFVPLILSFIPDYAPYVTEGFEALKGIPDYYWYVVFAVVIDTLGMRSMVRYLLEFFSYKFKER